MFLIGLNREGAAGAADLAILEKRLKHLKRHYRLVETAQWPAGTPEEIIGDALYRYVTDPRWTVRRKVFSQDRRPAKNVPTPPTVALRLHSHGSEGGDTAFIDTLRSQKLPVEGIAVTEAPGWRREDYSRLLLGHNYFVPGRDLRACFLRVHHQGRLSVAPSGPQPDPGPFGAPGAAPSLPPRGDAPLTGLWLAAALPLWLSETIRTIRRYGDAR
jgi:hypothetical protein